MYLIKMTQQNKEGKTVFEAKTKLDFNENDEFKGLGREIAFFAKETLELEKRSKARGNYTNIIRKSFGTSISIEALDSDDDIRSGVYYKNFCKFANKVDEGTLAEDIADHAEYVYNMARIDRTIEK